jgi:hypothetical protein
MLRRVTLEGNFNALGNETLAALLAAAAKNVTAGFGGHAGAEAELLFPGALGRLIGAFAHGLGLVNGGIIRPPGGSGDGTLGTESTLSIRQWWKFFQKCPLGCDADLAPKADGLHHQRPDLGVESEKR